MHRPAKRGDIQTVLFDLGNTLVDYHRGGLSDDEKDLLGLWNMVELLRRWKAPVVFDDLYDRFYLEWRRRLRYRKRRQIEISVEECLLPAIPERLHATAKLRRLLLAFHEPSARFCVLHEGAADLLKELCRRGYTLGLVANSPVPGYCHDATLRRLGIFEYFSIRQYSYDAGVRKPDEKFFRRVLEKLGADAANAALVGDSWRLEIEPSLRLGMRTFWYRPSGRDEVMAAGIDDRLHVVEHLGDVLKLLAR
jgi:putative hydrolase of the HAD superfamily